MIRAVLTAECCALALILGLPDDTFALGHGYDVMARTMSELHWAIVLAATAALGLLALLWPRRRLIQLSALACAFMFGWIGLCILLASRASLGTASYGTSAVLALWVVWAEASRP